MRLLVTTAVALAFALFASGCGSDVDPKSTTTERGSGQSSESPATDASPKPFNSSGLLGGDAKPELPTGDPNKIAVIAQAPLEKSSGLDSASLTFAFRNNTSETVGAVDWNATARVDGKIVATGSSQGTQPARLGPGEIGLGFIYFETGAAIKDGAVYEFSPSPRSTEIDFMTIVPLPVTEANRVGDAVVGSAANKNDVPVEGPFGAEIYCFAGNKLTGHMGSYAEENGPIPQDGAVNFTVDFYDTKCKTFAVGVSGFASDE